MGARVAGQALSVLKELTTELATDVSCWLWTRREVERRWLHIRGPENAGGREILLPPGDGHTRGLQLGLLGRRWGREQGEGRGGRRTPQLGQGSPPGWEADLDAVPPDEPVEHVYGGSLGIRVADAQVAQVGTGVAGQALAGLKPGTTQLAVQLSAPVTI